MPAPSRTAAPEAAFESDAVPAPRPKDRPVRLSPASDADSSGKVAVVTARAPSIPRSRILLAAGGGLGVLSSILPAASFSTNDANVTAILLDAGEGRLQFVTYVVALAAVMVLYRGRPMRAQRALGWTCAIASIASAVLGLFLFVAVMRGVAIGSPAPEATHSLSFDYTARVGAFSNLLASLLVLAGGILKGRDDRLLE
jgi:hypothetical protein